MKSRKAMELPINIVVMMIIGIILFGIGLSLFSKISRDAEANVDDLNDRIKTGIANLECNGEDWICSPTNTMKNGEKETFQVFISNRGEETKEYRIEYVGLSNQPDSQGWRDITTACGTLKIAYPNMNVNVISGTSASIPFQAKATQIKQVPCSFVITAKLMNSNTEVDKTAVIVLVE